MSDERKTIYEVMGHKAFSVFGAMLATREVLLPELNDMEFLSTCQVALCGLVETCLLSDLCTVKGEAEFRSMGESLKVSYLQAIDVAVQSAIDRWKDGQA